MNPPRDLLQAGGAVVAGEHGRHAGQQRLRGADVTGRFLTTDVLFPGLEREPQRRAAARILGDAHDAAGYLALKGVPGREVGRMRSTVTEGDAKTLRAAEGHVRAEFARWAKQGEAEQVRRYRIQRALRVRLLDKSGVVEDFPERVRILHQRPAHLVT